ncbi:hypothetical protein TCDM_10653 [Trypanosoma cruzi Dm28c]|uniref:Mucin TcMUCII n=1 Tax=Trypanosoma cruzi Dm28c TaxID=1416333 RepID=V5BBH1_TRYCR|nr:hypothetical protein TCDM_10653 [Trypanosoma cruzi Dm28c]
MDFFLFYSSLFNCLFCTLPARVPCVFRPTAPLAHHRHAHDDGPVRLACCTHEEGRDERRAEGAVTCGRATRTCGRSTHFFPLVFCFLCGQGWQTPAAPHTQPHPAAVFFSFCFFLFDGCVPPPCVIVDVGAVPHVSLPSSCASCCADVPPCAPLLFCSSDTQTKVFARCSAGMLLATAGRWLASRADMARPLRVCLRWESRCHWMDVCGTPFALCWWPADAAARCPPCEQVLPVLGVILLFPFVFALPCACVARCVLTRDGRCHDSIL